MNDLVPHLSGSQVIQGRRDHQAFGRWPPRPRALLRRLRSENGRMVVVSMICALVSRFGQLLLAMMLARAVGTSGYGVFTFATGAAALGANLGNLGWPNVTNRMLPGFVKDKQWGLLRGFRNAAEIVTFLGTATGAFVMILVGQLDAQLRSSFYYAAALIVPMGFTALRRQQLAAVNRPAIGLLFDQGLAAFGVAMIVLVFGSQRLPTVFGEYIAITCLGVVISGRMFSRRLPQEIDGARAEYRFWTWLTIALPMVLGSFSRLMMNRTDVLLLAPMTNLKEVALYGAAFRLTLVLTFPQIVLMTLLSSKLSEAYTHGRVKQSARLMHWAHLYAVVTAGPPMLAMVFFPGFIMRTVFGAPFAMAAPTLVVLALGQACSAAAIACNLFLMMSGKERAFGALSGGAFALNVVLNLVLIPLYGAFGSGLATLMASGAMLVGELFLVRRVFASWNQPVAARPDVSSSSS